MTLFRTTELNANVEFRSALCKIYGCGKYKSFKIASKLGLAYPFYMIYLNKYYYKLLFVLLEPLVWLEIRLKRLVRMNIVKLIDNASYRGKRHLDNLPCRGQRTRTNASTRKRLKFVRSLK